MSLPSEPGVYSDAQGDLWLLHDDGGWQHVGRRLSDGQLLPVPNYPGPVSAPALESLGQEPGVALLPLTRIELVPFPLEVDSDS